MQRELHIQAPLEEQVVHLASLANDNGADGVVCSVHEVERLKQFVEKSF